VGRLIKVDDKFNIYVSELSDRFDIPKTKVTGVLPQLLPEIKDIQIVRGRTRNKKKRMQVTFESELL